MKPEKRIAFAPSLGLNEIPEPYYSLFSEYLNSFRALSARENSGAEIISDMIKQEYTVLCDPCFLVNGKKWYELIKPIKKLESKKYVVKYILGVKADYIDKILGEIEIDYVVDIMDVNSLYYSIGPNEFLWLIKNAEMVITDSFHATVFSIIFQKDFTVVQRIGEGDTFNRIDTVLKNFDINTNSNIVRVKSKQLVQRKAIIQDMVQKTEKYIERVIES